MTALNDRDRLHPSEWAACIKGHAEELARVVFRFEDAPSAATKGEVLLVLSQLVSLCGALREELKLSSQPPETPQGRR